MRCLVLAALAACTIPDVHFTGSDAGASDAANDGNGETYPLPVAWILSNLGGQQLACPADTKFVVHTQSWDPETRKARPGTAEVTTEVLCPARSVELTVADPTQLVHVTLDSTSGSGPVQNSQIAFVDLKGPHPSVDLALYEDANYLGGSFGIRADGSGAIISCATAGIRTSDGIEIVSTRSGTSTAFRDTFRCDDHWAFQLLPYGSYDVTIVGRNAANVAVTSVVTLPALTVDQTQRSFMDVLLTH